MSAHTPGPWEADLLGIDRRTLDIHVVRQSDFGFRIASVSGTNIKVGDANACLIAAAPEMLEALRTIGAFPITNEQENMDAHNMARIALSALAKAEGRS